MRSAVLAFCALLISGCATVTPHYVIRPTPIPDESAAAHEIEQSISAYQAREFEQQQARLIGPAERGAGLAIDDVVQRISRVTERPSLPYRALVYQSKDPNAASLADGRIYISSGMLQYLAARGSRADELAFILGHELAHTVAQHLVKRYEQLQQQQLMLAVVGAGATMATRGSANGQQVGELAQDVASLIGNVIASGYSQDQELEADQLGIRYCMRAGYDPLIGLAMLEDFQRFDMPGAFLQTHPPTARRVEDLRRYLLETGALRSPATASPVPQESAAEHRQRLRDAQRFYPVGSVSWHNLQRQLDALDRR